MLAYPRQLLRRNLSPKTYNLLRYSRWGATIYVPRLLVSLVRRSVPRIVGLWNSSEPGPLQRLLAVNLRAPTRLCRIKTWYGSDKGKYRHNYTTVYSALFSGIRNKALRIFELGLGTNNPDLPSSMEVQFRPGASLRGWREFFPRALVYGADIDRDILFEEDRIKTYYCDQCDASSIRSMWSGPELQGCSMDIIIEDGLHTFESSMSFLNGSLEHLSVGGFYITEDIARSEFDKWIDVLETVYARRVPAYEFGLVALENEVNDYDNNLLIIHRTS